jgi:hypothetical protein
MEQHYKFDWKDYSPNGDNIRDGKFFLELLAEWEADFHLRFSPLFATHLLGNNTAMHLIKRCYYFQQNEDVGMELFDGEIDIDKSLAIEEHSKRTTIYAIGSGLLDNDDEPLFLVRDDDMVDGMVILKYVPENDESEDAPDVPVQSELVKVGS